MTMLARLLALFALAAAVPAAADTPAHPALWKVTRGATTVYLFGTVHVLPAGVDWYAGSIADAFEHSDALVTEILDKSPAEMKPILAATATLPPGQSLAAMMSAPDRRLLAAAAVRYGLPASTFDHYRPWYAAVALTTLPLLRSGYDPASGADSQLSAKAAAANRAHTALETPEFQLGLFAGLPMPVQKRYLHEVLRTLPKLTRELGEVVVQWERGDPDRLARLMNEDEDDPLLKQKLLVDRNRAWAKWVRDRLAQPGTVFVAVGAGHLAGDGSVQDQLGAMGIAATRVQ